MAADAKDNRGGLSSRARLALLAAAGASMLLPVLAIRGFNPAAWDQPGDLMFLAILLGGVGAALELSARISSRNAYRAAVGFAVVAALLHSWINLAVGIIGNEDNRANLIYYAVLGVAFAGAMLARFQPAGMAQAMVATAFAQMLVFFAALIAGLAFTGPITVFFMSLWLMSASLFAKAARDQARGGATR